jgi:hypothetical protein
MKVGTSIFLHRYPADSGLGVVSRDRWPVCPRDFNKRASHIFTLLLTNGFSKRDVRGNIGRSLKVLTLLHRYFYQWFI